MSILDAPVTKILGSRESAISLPLLLFHVLLYVTCSIIILQVISVYCHLCSIHHCWKAPQQKIRTRHTRNNVGFMTVNADTDPCFARKIGVPCGKLRHLRKPSNLCHPSKPTHSSNQHTDRVIEVHRKLVEKSIQSGLLVVFHNLRQIWANNVYNS